MGSVARESGSAERGDVASVCELAGQLMAKDGKVKVGIIGSQLAADLHVGPRPSETRARNSLNMPHRSNFDMSVLQFREEGFNIFNHTQWSTINNYVGYAEFPLLHPNAHAAGVAVCTSNYIFMVSSVKLIWGGKELARNVS